MRPFVVVVPLIGKYYKSRGMGYPLCKYYHPCFDGFYWNTDLVDAKLKDIVVESYNTIREKWAGWPRPK